MKIRGGGIRVCVASDTFNIPELFPEMGRDNWRLYFTIVILNIFCTTLTVLYVAEVVLQQGE